MSAESVAAFEPARLEVYLAEEDGLGLVGDIVDIFASDVPRRIESLRSAIVRGNDAECRRWAHAIKGGAATAGAARLAAIAERIERAAPTLSPDEGRACLERIGAAFAEACDAMTAWLKVQRGG